ncbi:MAG: 3-isopropylmalate dehydratase small subunit [Pseudomonadota bacterium]
MTGVAAALDLINIDTDMIIPKQFLKTIKRTGLGENLFHEMRFDKDGNIIEDFILNQPAYKHTKILIAGDNFGCGSSREHAPWSLLDFGIRCVISPSFADIFYNNCFKNGILPIILPISQVNQLMQQANSKEMTVDLEQQIIISTDSSTINFEIEPYRKKCLLEGLDDISLTLENVAMIEAFEQKQRQNQPWLYEASE